MYLQGRIVFIEYEKAGAQRSGGLLQAAPWASGSAGWQNQAALTLRPGPCLPFRTSLWTLQIQDIPTVPEACLFSFCFESLLILCNVPLAEVPENQSLFPLWC